MHCSTAQNGCSSGENQIQPCEYQPYRQNTDEVHGRHKLSEDKTKVVECAGGYAPLRHKFYADGTIKSEMTLGCCRLCKYRNRCFNRKELEKQELDAAKAAAKGSTPYFKTTWMRTNANKYMRASQQPDRNTRSFKDCSAYRNGIEAGVSTLKNGYDVIHMPPAGRIKRTMLFGLKVMAFNVSRCIHYLMRIRKAAAA